MEVKSEKWVKDYKLPDNTPRCLTSRLFEHGKGGNAHEDISIETNKIFSAKLLEYSKGGKDSDELSLIIKQTGPILLNVSSETKKFMKPWDSETLKKKN